MRAEQTARKVTSVPREGVIDELSRILPPPDLIYVSNSTDLYDINATKTTAAADMVDSI